MYSFEPNEEQQMLVDAVGKYAINDLRIAAHDAEESHELPKKLVNKGWELGLLQASVSESYGGFGDRSAVTGALAVGDGLWWPGCSYDTVSFTRRFYLAAVKNKSRNIYQRSLAAIDPHCCSIEFSFDFDHCAQDQ
jgi:alkylation response protein AidB-like acyl-CoA dehydrogenase